MSVRRVMGTEVEYGISVQGQPLANPMVASSQVVNAYASATVRARRARWDFEEESPLRDARGFDMSRQVADPSQLTDEDLGLANVILTPHVGGSTQEAQAAIGVEVAVALAGHLRTGRTLGCVDLPQLDAPLREGTCRIVNVHRNVPGVLSKVNQVVAESNVNILAQYLSTLDDVGLLFVDVALAPGDPRPQHLAGQIGALEVSIRTRLVSG